MDERLGRPWEVKGVQSGLGRCLLACSDRKMGIEAWPGFALATTDLLAKLYVALPARGDQPACRRWVRWSLRRRDQLAARRRGNPGNAAIVCTCLAARTVRLCNRELIPG